MFIIVHPHSIIDIYHSHESWDVFYFTTSCASDRAAVASRPGSVRAFSILEPPISTKTPWKRRPKRKLLKLYHTTYLFRKPPFQKKKRQGPIRNLDLRGETSQIFVGAIRMAWRLKPRRSGERREPVALLESIPRSTTWTAWNPTTMPQQKSSKSSKVPSMWKAVPSDNRQPIFPPSFGPSRNGHIQRQHQKQVSKCNIL